MGGSLAGAAWAPPAPPHRPRRLPTHLCRVQEGDAGVDHGLVGGQVLGLAVVVTIPPVPAPVAPRPRAQPDGAHLQRRRRWRRRRQRQRQGQPVCRSGGSGVAAALQKPAAACARKSTHRGVAGRPPPPHSRRAPHTSRPDFPSCMVSLATTFVSGAVDWTAALTRRRCWRPVGSSAGLRCAMAMVIASCVVI